MKLAIVIPAFNEAKKIETDLKACVDFLKGQAFESEVWVVSDGSTDATASIARDFSKYSSTPKVSINVEEYFPNRGKGYAVRTGVAKTTAENIAFVDAGLCVPYTYLLEGLKLLEMGSDVAIASRRLSSSRIRQEQPLYRRFGSFIFWKIIRLFLGITVTDTQCGFKLYKGEVGRALFSRLQTDGFMFDIEALVLARRLGLKVAEFPVEWSNDQDTRYNPVFGTLRNLKELISIRFNAKKKREEDCS